MTVEQEAATAVVETRPVEGLLSLDRALVLRAAQADREAFDALVRTHLDSIHRLARAILGNDADASDAVQETFVSAWRTIHGLRDPEAFDPWLRRIAINACRQHLRRRARSSVREVAMTPENDDLRSPDPTPDDRTAEADRFDRAFARLTVEDRAVLVLHHFDDRPVAEIATALGVRVGTVKSRLFRARAALESALAKESR